MNDKEKHARLAERYAKLAELYAAMADGKTLQVRDNDIGWCDTCHYPEPFCDLTRWRVTPEPREFVGEVGDGIYRNHVVVPENWPRGTRVRVTEIVE